MMDAGDEDSPSNATVPSVKIFGTVISPTEENEEGWDPFFFLPLLIDEWWKLLIWALAGFLVLCLFCYCFKCCYFLWDCCSDPYWGYCPCLRTPGCERCCALGGKKDDPLPEDLEEIIISEKLAPSIISEPKSDKRILVIRDDDDMVDGDVIGGTALFDEEGSMEALPQLYNGHYFNVMHFFGLGKSKRSYTLDSGLTSTNISFDDCASYHSTLPQSDVELVAIQTGGRNPKKMQKSIQELSPPRVYPVKEENEDDVEREQEISPLIYSSTPTFKSNGIGPLIPTKAIPESLNTTRTSSYNEDTGSLLEQDSVQMMLFGRETIL